jgi:hypothetical protein
VKKRHGDDKAARRGGRAAFVSSFFHAERMASLKAGVSGESTIHSDS